MTLQALKNLSVYISRFVFTGKKVNDIQASDADGVVTRLLFTAGSHVELSDFRYELIATMLKAFIYLERVA